MPVVQSVRRRTFPSLAEESGHGYLLKIPVPGNFVDIAPPQHIAPQETNCWPAWSFQLLLVGSEYCAALLEFMTWAFPDDPFPNNWAPLKAQVARYARQLIRTSAPVPPPEFQPGCPQSWQQRNAHCVWAAFTHCYFHGLRPADGDEDRDGDDSDIESEWRDATTWLRRLVGEWGWRSEGSVFRVVDKWVQDTILRLRTAYPEEMGQWESSWEASHAAGACSSSGSGGVLRVVVCRGDSKTEATRPSYYPTYPKRFTGGCDRNQLKWKLKDEECDRTIKGSCGVPVGFTQSDNCALGFLVPADVIEAYMQATKRLVTGPEDLRRNVTKTFIRTVLQNDAAALHPGHLQYGYPAALAHCALGWRQALVQLPAWVAAAAGSVAATGMMQPEAPPLELLMPRDLSVLPVSEHVFPQLLQPGSQQQLQMASQKQGSQLLSDAIAHHSGQHQQPLLLLQLQMRPQQQQQAPPLPQTPASENRLTQEMAGSPMPGPPAAASSPLPAGSNTLQMAGAVMPLPGSPGLALSCTGSVAASFYGYPQQLQLEEQPLQLDTSNGGMAESSAAVRLPPPPEPPQQQPRLGHHTQYAQFQQPQLQPQHGHQPHPYQQHAHAMLPHQYFTPPALMSAVGSPAPAAFEPRFTLIFAQKPLRQQQTQHEQLDQLQGQQQTQQDAAPTAPSNAPSARGIFSVAATPPPAPHRYYQLHPPEFPAPALHQKHQHGSVISHFGVPDAPVTAGLTHGYAVTFGGGNERLVNIPEATQPPRPPAASGAAGAPAAVGGAENGPWGADGWAAGLSGAVAVTSLEVDTVMVWGSTEVRTGLGSGGTSAGMACGRAATAAAVLRTAGGGSAAALQLGTANSGLMASGAVFPTIATATSSLQPSTVPDAGLSGPLISVVPPVGRTITTQVGQSRW